MLEVFGNESPEYREHQYHRIWQGAEYVDMDDEYCQSCFAEGMKQTEGLLEGLIRRLEEARQDFSLASAAGLQERSHGQRVFIGHGHSEAWRQLKDLLVDRLGLQFEEFNRQPVPGIATKERLEAMLDSTCFAFLLMTAEDVQPDGSKHVRENVIHEVGLFQGRHGFRRAIVLLEEGCEEFSNIHGVGQIRFPRGNVMARSEEIRRVLEREGVLKKDSA
jgi:predicted nucleotide-binding protein